MFIVKDILEAQTHWMSRCGFLMLRHMVHDSRLTDLLIRGTSEASTDHIFDVAVKKSVFLSIREVIISNLGSDTGYSN